MGTTFFAIVLIISVLIAGITCYAIGVSKGYEQYDIDVERIRKNERSKILKEEADAKSKLKYIRADQALAIMESVVIIPPVQHEMIKNKLYNSLT